MDLDFDFEAQLPKQHFKHQAALKNQFECVQQASQHLLPMNSIDHHLITPTIESSGFFHVQFQTLLPI